MKSIPLADARIIEKSLSFHQLIIALKQAFADASIFTPERHHHDYSNPLEAIDSTLLMMPSWISGSHLGVKLVTISPNNYKYNLPSVQGLYVFFVAIKGMPLLLLDAQELTARRTAASSALASSFLSRGDSETLLMIGTGKLAPYLIEAHASIRAFKRILIWGRNRQKAQAICNRINQKMDITVNCIEDLEKGIKLADVVSCATLSVTPLILGSWLKSGQHIDLVGAYKSDEKIIGPLLKLDEEITKADLNYYRTKLNRARTTQGIDDPRIARNKFINNVVYIKQNNKYFDLTTNQEYSKDAINFEYSRLYAEERGGPVFHLQNSPKRRSVENWVYDPTQYKKGDPLIKINGLSYLNSYQPNDLVAVKGDTSLWHKMLNHVFTGPSKYKDHFVNFHAYNLQNPGVKQRHGLVVVSTEFQFGKGSLFRALQSCYGVNNSLAIDVKQALDKSKGYLCNSMLVLVDEMQSSGKWEESQNVLNDMKRIITEKEVSSRSLFVDYKIVKTCTNYMFFSNKKDALKLPPNEVRYWVYVTNRKRLPQEYYIKE